MLKIFIYDEVKDRWIDESQILLFHDLAAIFDEEKHSIFLWKGNTLEQSKFQKGLDRLKALLTEMKLNTWKIINAENKFPTKVKRKLEEMLQATKQRKKEENLKFNHLLTIRLTFLFLLMAVVFTIISFINLIRVFFYPKANNTVQISASQYEVWLTLYQVFTILQVICIACNLIISIYEGDIELFIFSLISSIITIGILLYIRYDIFLFLNQRGSTYTLYLIPGKELTTFVLLNSMALSIIFASNSFKLYKFIFTYWNYIIISANNGVELGIEGS